MKGPPSQRADFPLPCGGCAHDESLARGSTTRATGGRRQGACCPARRGVSAVRRRHPSAAPAWLPAFDRRIERAQALQAVDPERAAVEWAKLDRYVTDRAVPLPTVYFRETDVLSPRVGNYQYHVLWGPLVDQLWVR